MSESNDPAETRGRDRETTSLGSTCRLSAAHERPRRRFFIQPSSQSTRWGRSKVPGAVRPRIGGTSTSQGRPRTVEPASGLLRLGHAYLDRRKELSTHNRPFDLAVVCGPGSSGREPPTREETSWKQHTTETTPVAPPSRRSASSERPGNSGNTWCNTPWTAATRSSACAGKPAWASSTRSRAVSPSFPERPMTATSSDARWPDATAC